MTDNQSGFRFLKEPLLHFFVLGLIIFGVYFILSSNADGEISSEKHISISKNDFLKYLQYRVKAFKPGLAVRLMESMDKKKYQEIMGDIIKEEVLFREAKRYGLDKDDYVIKRRMIQKMNFIAKGIINLTNQISHDDVRTYFIANREKYKVQPSITFTHVFYNTSKGEKEKAKKTAEAKLEELNIKGVEFSEAPKHGQRFLYHLNYVERTPDYIGSHFGADMAKKLFQLKADTRKWHGPFKSPYGYHLVMISANHKAYYPELKEVKGKVRDDLKRKMAREQTEKAVKKLISSYDVDIDKSIYQNKAEVARK